MNEFLSKRARKMSQFKKMGYGGLWYAITKYHGGKYAVMERSGYNEEKIEELAKELEKIVRKL